MANIRKELKIEGANLWYLVGLVTSDGCLSSDGRHIDITSKDYEFLSKIKNRLGLKSKIGVKNRHRINEAHHIQISNKNFYEFLLSIGLTARKSLILDKVAVPDEFFRDFFRGLIDGDGSIRKWIHSSNKREQWSLTIYSPSISFMSWLKRNVERLLYALGQIHRDKRKEPRVDLFVLKYGKFAARAILNKCYYKDSFNLDRKAKLAQDCLNSYKGWSNSKTVLN